jgi:hypothetical protein
MQILKTAIALATVTLASEYAHSAQYCITSETALYSALMNSAISPEADDIRLVKGLININVNLDTTQKINGDLALRGGYDAGCTTRADVAAMTKVMSQNNRIRLFPRQESSITIERLDFDGLESFLVVDNITNTAGDYGLVLVSRSAFRNGHTGLLISVLRHNVRVENSLFINNNRTASSTGLTVETAYNSNTGQDATASLVNCTLRGNGVGVWIGSWIAGPNLTASSIVNSISTGNVVDVILARPTQVRYSMYGTLSSTDSGVLAAGSIRNSIANPLLDANQRPGSNSRAIDNGDSAAVPIPAKARDYYGNTRIQGQAVDIGAVEISTGFGLGGF